MPVVFDESNLLFKNCEEYVEHPEVRETVSNEKKWKRDSTSKETHNDLPRKTRIFKDHPKDQAIKRLTKGGECTTFSS